MPYLSFQWQTACILFSSPGWAQRTDTFRKMSVSEAPVISNACGTRRIGAIQMTKRAPFIPDLHCVPIPRHISKHSKCLACVMNGFGASFWAGSRFEIL